MEVDKRSVFLLQSCMDLTQSYLMLALHKNILPGKGNILAEHVVQLWHSIPVATKCIQLINETYTWLRQESNAIFK